jgi:hypothetical protein
VNYTDLKKGVPAVLNAATKKEVPVPHTPDATTCLQRKRPNESQGNTTAVRLIILDN